MSWLGNLLKKSVAGGSFDIIGRQFGVNNDNWDNHVAKDAAAEAAKAANEQRVIAEQQAAATDAEAARQKQMLVALQGNSAALSNANVSNVQGIITNIVAGGSAGAIDGTAKKRKLPVPGIASSLGINL